jgi:hypothetical protein
MNGGEMSYLAVYVHYKGEFGPTIAGVPSDLNSAMKIVEEKILGFDWVQLRFIDGNQSHTITEYRHLRPWSVGGDIACKDIPLQ